MKNTQFKVEDTFGDIICKDSISPEQITKLNKLLAKTIYKLIFVKRFKVNLDLIYLNLGRKKIDIQPSAPPEYNFYY